MWSERRQHALRAEGLRASWAHGCIFLVAFLLCLPMANWLIGHWGMRCLPGGPCVVPVAPGLEAPSGVLLVGLALVLRDFVQRHLGRMWALGAIAAGVALTAALAPPTLALASAAAFLASELVDFASFTLMEEQGLLVAVAVSSMLGLVLDSALFLWLAFGSLEHIAGQVVGKVLMVGMALGVLRLMQGRAEVNAPREAVFCWTGRGSREHAEAPSPVDSP